MIDHYDAMPDGPRFMYMLTFQNHGGYEKNDDSLDVIHVSEDFGDLTDDLITVTGAAANVQSVAQSGDLVETGLVVLCRGGASATAAGDAQIDVTEEFTQGTVIAVFHFLQGLPVDDAVTVVGIGVTAFTDQNVVAVHRFDDTDVVSVAGERFGPDGSTGGEPKLGAASADPAFTAPDGITLTGELIDTGGCEPGTSAGIICILSPVLLSKSSIGGSVDIDIQSAGSVAHDAEGGTVCQYSRGKKHYGKSQGDKNTEYFFLHYKLPFVLAG